MTDKTNPNQIHLDNADSINTKDSNWGWFSVWSPKQGSTKRSSRNASSAQSYDGNLEFEVVQQEMPSKSYTASHDHMLLENNLQIHEQYVNLNEYGTTLPVIPIDDDEKDKNTKTTISNTGPHEENQNEDGDHGENGDKVQEMNEDLNDDKTANVETEAVMISQTLTLRSRNQELEKERDDLQSETLQLRMQTQCLQQTNQHIIAVKYKQINFYKTIHSI